MRLLRQRRDRGMAEPDHPAAARRDLPDRRHIGADIGVARLVLGAFGFVSEPAFADVQGDQPGVRRHPAGLQRGPTPRPVIVAEGEQRRPPLRLPFGLRDVG